MRDSFQARITLRDVLGGYSSSHYPSRRPSAHGFKTPPLLQEGVGTAAMPKIVILSS
jgi:hypothetical protein